MNSLSIFRFSVFLQDMYPNLYVRIRQGSLFNIIVFFKHLIKFDFDENNPQYSVGQTLFSLRERMIECHDYLKWIDDNIKHIRFKF